MMMKMTMKRKENMVEKIRRKIRWKRKLENGTKKVLCGKRKKVRILLSCLRISLFYLSFPFLSSLFSPISRSSPLSPLFSFLSHLFTVGPLSPPAFLTHRPLFPFSRSSFSAQVLTILRMVLPPVLIMDSIKKAQSRGKRNRVGERKKVSTVCNVRIVRLYQGCSCKSFFLFILFVDVDYNFL